MKKLTKEQVIHEVLSYIKTIACYMLVTYVICSKIITQANVPTGSMEETIMTGSRVIINRTAYWLEEPERGDIVAFHFPDNESELFLKRIIGMPGEVIEGNAGKIYINGKELEEPYIKQVICDNFGSFVIPADSYFMMGDNRNNSNDSRYWNKKYVTKTAIIGKVGIELYPEIKFLK